MNYIKIKILMLIIGLPLMGCGVLIDMSTDEEWRWGSFGNIDFVSPIKLRVGVLPFKDEVGLGASETGTSLGNLMAEELSRDDRIIVIPPEEVAQVMGELGISPSADLAPQEIAALGTAMRLNAVVEGSLSEIRKYNLRKGWRKVARLLTSQRQYVDAVLAVKAVDAQTGILLASRVNTGEHDGGSAEKDFFEGDDSGQPSQEALEASLNAALSEAFYRTRLGLSKLPFKATIIYTGDGVANITFGEDVGLEVGTEFTRLENLHAITNALGETYQIMGASVARLRVTSVSPTSATLEILEGTIYPGDIIQAVVPW